MGEPAFQLQAGQMGARVLVVDDDPAQLKVHCALLNAAGFHTEGHTDPYRAVDALATGQYAALLADLAMPRLDGLGLVAQARRHDPDLCCVLLTAAASVPSALEAMKLGAFDYLEKPFDMQHVVLTLNNGIERRRLLAAQARAERALADSLVTVTGLNHALARAGTRAEQTSRSQAAFIAEFSLELRVPLTTICGFSRLLAAMPPDAPEHERQRFLGHLVQASGHLMALLERLPALGAPDPAQARPVDPGAVGANVVAMLAGAAEAGGLTLALQCAPALALHGDAARLRHVLLSLLTHALGARRRGGTVALHIAPGGNGVGFTVTDRGRARRQGGASLHLAGAAALVATMGGQLEVHDRAGSTERRFVLPAALA